MKTVFPSLDNITQCTHAACWLSCLYSNSTNLDNVCPLSLFNNWHRFNIAILFGFFTSVELKAFEGQIEHTKTLPSVITQAGVTLPLISQSHSLLWGAAKCHSPEMCVEMNSKQVSCVGFVGTWMQRRGFWKIRKMDRRCAESPCLTYDTC